LNRITQARITEAVIYLLFIAGAEAVTVFYVPPWGIFFHIAVITSLLVRSAIEDNYLHRRFMLPLTLVPILRVINLGMSSADIPQVALHHLSNIILLLSAAMVISILRYNANDIGLNSKWLGRQLLAGATGILLGWAGYVILRPEIIVADFAQYDIWLGALILLLCSGFATEFVFRGVIQHSAEEVFGGWGIVYVSLLYAILYMESLPMTWMAFAFTISLCFGWVVKATKSILGVAVAHSILNITLYLIIPFFF
jgi:membrane protease YdiL (CAAX protease family)